MATTRLKTVGNLVAKKFKYMPFDGVWAQAMGTPTAKGIILVYGPEKNGKTWFSLKLAEYLSRFDRVLYVSAEEGLESEFVQTVKRSGLEVRNRRIHFDEYCPIDELDVVLSKRKSRRIIILDNMTIYSDEFKNGKLRQFTQKHNDKLFVIIAHEERNEPYPSTAKVAKRLAKIIVQVKGLKCTISGRCPGGIMNIDEERAALYWGELSNN